MFTMGKVSFSDKSLSVTRKSKNYKAFLPNPAPNLLVLTKICRIADQPL